MKVMCFKYFVFADSLLLFVERNKIKKNDIQQIIKLVNWYEIFFWKNPKKKLIDIKEFE